MKLFITTILSLFLFLTASPLKVIDETPSSLLLKFDISNSYSERSINFENGEFFSISFEDSYIKGGHPETENPSYSKIFALPNNKKPTIDYQIRGSKQISKNFVSAPISQTNTVSESIYRYTENIVLSDFDPIKLSSLGYVDGFYLYKITISPVDYHSKTIITSFDIDINYNGRFSSKKISSNRVFSDEIINSRFGSPVKEINRVKTFRDDNSIYLRDSDLALVTANRRGLTKLTYSELSSIEGFNREVPIEKVRVLSLNGGDLDSELDQVNTNIEVSIPREIFDTNNDGVFNGDDYLQFFASGRLSKTTQFESENKFLGSNYWAKFFNDNCYYLIEYSNDSVEGRDFQPALTQFAQPDTTITRFVDKHFEDKRDIYTKVDPADEAYIRGSLLIESGETKEINYDLISSTDSLFYRIVIVNGLRPAISVNGTTFQFSSSGTKHTAYIPPSALHSGANRVSLTNNSSKSLLIGSQIFIQRSSKILPNREVDIYSTPMSKMRITSSGFDTIYEITDPNNPKMSSITTSNLDLVEENLKTRVLLFDPAIYSIDGLEKFNFKDQNIRSKFMGKNYDIVIISPNIFYDYWVGEGGDVLNPSDEDNFIKTHFEYDTLKTVVINLEDINQQFGRGYQEPNATRNFIRYAKESWGAEYFIFSGDGHYDYRNRYTSTSNLIYPYYSNMLLNGTFIPVDRTSSDDLYANTTNNEPAEPSVSLGRFTVNNINELKTMVKKTVDFMVNPDIEIAKLSLLFTADDEYTPSYTREHYHVRNTETTILPQVPDRYLLDKLYMWDYPKVINSSTGYFENPDSEKDLIRKLNKGTNLYCYVGHGSSMRLSHENLMRNSTLDKLNNRNTFLFMAASCSVGNFEDVTLHGGRPLMENLLLLSSRGAHSAIASPRSCSIGANETLFKQILRSMFDENGNKSQGLSLKLGKLLYSDSNSSKFMLFGDPALKIFRDVEKVKTVDLDQIHTMQLDSIKTKVDNGEQIDGSMMFAFKESDSETFHYNETWSTQVDTVWYAIPGDIVFKGLSSVNSGESIHRFILPKDLTSTTEGTTIHFYGKDGNDEISNYTDQFQLIQGSNQNSDSTPPTISVKFNSESYQEGDPISSNSLIYIDLFDESGINISGSIGHTISLELDGVSYDLNPNFTYYLDSYRKGYTFYQMENVTVGEHSLKVSAFDNFNNYAEVNRSFKVESSEENREHSIGNLLNYPNPASDFTTFSFTATEPLKISGVSTKIFTINGRLIKKVDKSNFNVSGNFITSRWNLRDDDGDKPANGVYIYKTKVYYDDGSSVEKKGKLIISK